MRTYFFRIVCVILLYSSCNLFAFGKSIYKDEQWQGSDNTWFVGVGGGAYWARLPNSSTTVPNGSPQPAPYNQDLYTIQNPSINSAFQVNAGYRWHMDQRYISDASLFLQYRHYLDANVKGNIYQYSLPDFLNYNYRFPYSADLFTLNGKLDLANFHNVMPYISGGVGAIINRLEDYTETPTANVTPRTSPGFSADSSAQFAATLGAGVDVTLTQNVWLTLGYEHVFQTGLPSASGSNTWAGTSLDLGNIKLDTVFLSISAKIPDTFRSIL